MARLIMAEGAAPSTPSTGKAALWIDTDGNLRVKTDGGTENLYVPQTAGAWTPTISGSSTAGAHTYTTQLGRYVKIGSLVMAHFRIQINAKDGAMAGTIRISGLPFTAESTASLNRAGSIAFWNTLVTAFTWVGIFVSPGTTEAPITGATAAATAATNLVAADVQNGSRFDGMVVYET